MLNPIIKFCLHNKLIVTLAVIMLLLWGVMSAPFNWDLGWLPRNPVPVDAIPDIGENQQIVFTEWKGRSPQDIEDQITYPMTVSLMGISGVKTIRSYSYFGFSSIYIIFDESVEFYWSRSRVLEKLNSLPSGLLPDNVTPMLGPDATALGQVFWYTLEGRDPDGNPTGGWDLHELRSAQDWYVRYALMSTEGVSEVASVGGFVREYQIDVDPNAMQAYGVTLQDIFNAVRQSNVDVGARTIEINQVEYVIRGLGFLENVDDIRQSVIKSSQNVPVTIDQVATVSLGPAQRRGALDKEGAEAVGGVVVVRYGENPLRVIQNVKEKIAQISQGLPKKTLADGTVSQVTIIPFYDRTDLILETLGTLNTALIQQILVTIIVVLVMVNHFRSSLLIAGLLPMAVLICFVAMKQAGVDANIVALSGIAIAIGTMVDMGIIISENIYKRLQEAPDNEPRIDTIFNATSEVGSAVLTSGATTIVSFLPVFTLQAAEGKLFKPLAFTKTFALMAAIMIAVLVIPPFAYLLLGGERKQTRLARIINIAAVVLVTFILTLNWMPLGIEAGTVLNLLFVVGLIGGLLTFFYFFQRFYEPMLRYMLEHKLRFLMIPSMLVILGGFVWLGFDSFFGFMPNAIKQTRPYSTMAHAFPGLGKEFMPQLDEGSFLYMPTTMPHASIGEALDVVQTLDMAITSIPEVEQVVGKIGRADSPLDPAPVSMIETIINYKSEYKTNADGKRIRFKFDSSADEFVRDENGELIEDFWGKPFRQWRETISSPRDIWDEIIKATKLPGTTSAPMLQPISTRIVMLQSGMRAAMGIKIYGNDLDEIEQVGLQMEQILKEIPAVRGESVLADRIVGKPYLEIDINREAIARYGITIERVQQSIEIAVGGRTITTTVEGRERYPVRVRYQRELRDSMESLGDIRIASPSGIQVPLRELSEVRYIRGPQMIKSEDTFLVGYVTFDKLESLAEVDVVEQCQTVIASRIANGTLEIPAGVSYRFSGSYENQIRSEKRLRVVLPLALFIIYIILYLQFKEASKTLLIFSGILVAWSGGFIMIWLYAQPWFLDFSLLGVSMREVFQVKSYNLSVAVWVGFLALFGIATDDGVVMLTYIKQSFANRTINSIGDIRETIVLAGLRRIRPCLMTSATTILALLPVLTSTGRGSDVMIPMAIPSFGGMSVVLITVFVVPVLACWIEEVKFRRSLDR